MRAVTPTKTPQERRGGADISCSELIGPPLVNLLRNKYWDFIEDDASNRLWMLLGTTIHNILHSHSEHRISERELVIERHGWTIRGQFDLLDETAPFLSKSEDRGVILSDYKTTSSWSYVFKDGDEDKTAQLNIYKLMIEERLGIKVDSVQNVMLFRDWKASELLRDPQEYPERACMVVKRDFWPNAKTEAYIEGRLRAHSNPDPVCTPKERWYRGEKFAVMKEGAKRAVRVWDTEEEAAQFVEEFKVQHDGKYTVVKRDGVAGRCLRYCPCWELCPVGQVVRRGATALEEPP